MLLLVTALFVSASSGNGELLIGDNPLVQKVQEIISNLNNYLQDHKLEYLPLPNLGLPLDPVKLKEGKLGQLDTITLQGDPIIYQQDNTDGSITYTFDLNLGLNILIVEYQFHVSLIGPFSQDGQVVITPQTNSLRAKGIVVVGPGSSCSARLDSADVTRFEDFQIDLEPNDFNFVTLISQTILNFVSPKLLPLTNTVINTSLLLPTFQEKFEDLVCKHM